MTIEDKGKLVAADALAEFANLEPNQAAVDAFRLKHTDFFPDTFWPEGRTGFPQHLLLANALGPTYTQFQDSLRHAWEESFPLEKCIRMVASGGSFAGDRLYLFGTTYPYQDAVMFMHEQPWRAKTCQECHRRFVADHAKRRYCSVMFASPSGGWTKCSQVRIKASHNKWGRENNWGRPRRQPAGSHPQTSS